MKDIVIIANFCRDFSETDNGRFMYLCKELSKCNCVEIITSDFGHSAKKHKQPLKHTWPFTITFLHELGYNKNISIKRFKSHYYWGKEVSKYLKKRNKPDVIYCAVPSLTASYHAAKYCKSNNVKFIVDIQDLWPEAFKLALNIPIISDLLFAPFNVYVNRIYKQADCICAVSKTYADRALKVNRKCKDATVVFLGTKLETFDKFVLENPVEKTNNELWIGYCGTLGASYDITCVINALVLIREAGVVPPKFVVMGDGPRLKEFETYANCKNIDALFTGRLPYDKMCGMLSACDITVNPITGGAAQSIINKHGDYAASGLPVINTQECNEYRELVDKYQMGINCRNENPEDISKAVIKLIEDEQLRKKMGCNARKCAEECFDREVNYLKIIELF